MRELRSADPALRKILQPQKVNPSEEYVRSMFALPYEHGGERVWFHTLTRQMVSGIPDIPERISGKEIAADPELSELARGYFMAPAGKDESSFYTGLYRILNALVQTKGVMKYVILPTTACNARCVYCFEQGRRQETMKPGTAEQVVQYIRETKGDGEIEILWFGGEPLAAVPIIDCICEGLRKNNILYWGNMVTNGSLITEEMADRMRDFWKIRNVHVSMDGKEEDYIARKRYVKGGDHYHTVLRNIRFLAERGIRVQVHCNTDGDNLPGAGEFLADLAAAVPDKRNVDVCFFLLDQDLDTEREIEVRRQMLEINDRIRSLGFPGKDSRLRLHGLRNYFCLADRGSIVIAPDGSLYACECCPENSRIGHLTERPDISEARKQFTRIERQQSECTTCPFLTVCTPYEFCAPRSPRCRERRALLVEMQVRAFLKGEISAEEDTDPDENGY